MRDLCMRDLCMRDLERVTRKLATRGEITTRVVYSSPIPSRHITPA